MTQPADQTLGEEIIGWIETLRVPEGGKLSVACTIALDDAVARAKFQHGVIAVAQFLFQNDAFEVAQRRRHRLKTLPERHEFFRDDLLGKGRH